MRNLILIAALTCASPALAQPVSDSVEDSEIARALPHPFEVEQAGDRLSQAIGALLQVPIGGVIRSVDPAAPMDPEQTIGEFAGGGDPEFDGRIQDEMRGLTLKAADLARYMAAAAPALERSLAELQRNLTDALAPYEE